MATSTDTEPSERLSDGERFWVGILVFIVSLMAYGFTFMLLFNWFVASTFKSIPELNFGQAMGIFLLIDFCTVKFTPRPANKSKTQHLVDLAKFDLDFVPFVLVAGFLLHLLVR